MREHVLDVRLLEEPHAGAHQEGNPAPRQLHLQLHRVRVRPVEHRHFAQPDAFLAQLEDALGDELRLLMHVAQRHQGRQHPSFAVRAQLLLELLAIAGDGRVRQREDRRRAAVVREQAQLLALRMAFGELEDVLEVRAAEGVDALRIVADDQQVPMRRRGDVDDLALQAVGILVLVDQHRGKPPADALARGRHLDEQPFPVQEQVVEIHRVHLRLALREAAGDTQDLLFQRDELWRLRRDHLRQRPLRVDGGRVQIDQRVGPGKPALSDAISEVGGGARHHLLGVLAIEQPEPIRVAESRGVLPQEPMGDVMERAAPHPARFHPAKLADARHHLPRRLVGERQQQDLLRRSSGLEQVRHAIRQRPRLS